MKKIFLLSIFMATALASAHAQYADTVVVELAKSSKVMLLIKDQSDVAILKHYNFQELFLDILKKVESRDTTALPARDSAAVAITTPSPQNEDWSSHQDDNDDNNVNEDWHMHDNHWGHTWQSFNFDLGTNNYLSNGKFPDADNALYSVRPWGSWYFAASSVQRTRLGKKFFLEWALGMSWYTFKYQKDNVLMEKDDDGVHFIADTRFTDYEKSKLSASYVMASLVPVVDFGDHSRKARIWEGYHSSFRVGLGPYLAYRISSHSKLVYDSDGKEKEKNNDSFYLNNVRYGLRLQIGYRSTDLFFNYDLNELYTEGKGPSLNAFSFGVIF